MTVTINEVTSEVTAEINGTTFRFHGTTKRMGEMEQALGVTGLLQVYEKLNLQSAQLTPLILAALCSSGHTRADFDALPFGKCMPLFVRAIGATITGSLPPVEDEEPRGNGAATRATGARRGAATAKSLLAS
jgi:hypothetical protein